MHTNPTLLHTLKPLGFKQDSLWLSIFCPGFLCTAFSAWPGFNFAISELKSQTLCQEKPIHGCHLPPLGQIPTLCSSAVTETRPACFPPFSGSLCPAQERDFIRILKATLQSHWQMTAQLGLFLENVGKARNPSPWLYSHVTGLPLSPYLYLFLSTGMVAV